MFRNEETGKEIVVDFKNFKTLKKKEVTIKGLSFCTEDEFTTIGLLFFKALLEDHEINMLEPIRHSYTGYMEFKNEEKNDNYCIIAQGVDNNTVFYEFVYDNFSTNDYTVFFPLFLTFSIFDDRTTGTHLYDYFRFILRSSSYFEAHDANFESQRIFHKSVIEYIDLVKKAFFKTSIIPECLENSLPIIKALKNSGKLIENEMLSNVKNLPELKNI